MWTKHYIVRKKLVDELNKTRKPGLEKLIVPFALPILVKFDLTKLLIIVFLLLIVYIKIHIRFVSALTMFNQYTTYSNRYSTNGSLIDCAYTIDNILILDCQPIVDWWSVDMSVDYTRLMHEQYPTNISIDDWHLSNISIIDMLTGTWPICRPIHCT